MKNYRYERKFFIENISYFEVEQLVRNNPLMFSEVYYPRYINNIYFDTPILSNYFDNINGNFNRQKVRIRWYDSLVGEIADSNIEIKIKKGDLGEKKHYPTNNFSMVSGQRTKIIQKIILDSKIGEQFKINGLLPTIINRYKRKYYQSFDKKFRITIDSNLSFYGIDKNYISLLKRYHDSSSIILELKYSYENDNFAREVTNHFPFRLTKSSKYVIGIDKL